MPGNEKISFVYLRYKAVFFSGMQWSEGDIWSVEVKAPPGEYDFKCVVIRQDGSIAEWEPGENRCLKVGLWPHL